ncbi:MAG: hypothetical protein WC919_05350 [Candidatus Paceibacterota bacterium]|jgi:hypothetical protein
MALFGFGKRPSPPPSRPVPKAPPKPAEKPKGLFGEKSYQTFGNLKQFARKAPYEAAPKYGKKFSKQERTGLVDTLKKYSGSSYGLSKQKFDTALKKMQKEKMYTKDYKVKKELDQKIKMLEKWKQGN